MDLYDVDKDTLQIFWHEKGNRQKSGEMKRNTCIDEIINEGVRARSNTFKNNGNTYDAEIFDVEV